MLRLLIKDVTVKKRRPERKALLHIWYLSKMVIQNCRRLREPRCDLKCWERPVYEINRPSQACSVANTLFKNWSSSLMIVAVSRWRGRVIV